MFVKSRGGTGGDSYIGVVGSDTHTHGNCSTSFVAVTALSGTVPKNMYVGEEGPETWREVREISVVEPRSRHRLASAYF